MAFVAIVIVAWKNVPSGQNDQLTYYTLWLTLSTALLAVATFMLVLVARQQFVDSRFMNRAYVSVEPRGLSPWRGEANRFLGHVAIVNSGVLPARNLRWVLCIEMSNDGDKQDFAIPSIRRGSQIVGARGTMARGTPPIGATGESYCFVWGLVTYDDGFGVDQTTNFCHRYNCNRDDFRRTLSIDDRDARQHEFGNSTS
ncbi:MAG: hypothetical protein EOP22_08555 [Hyphomicrobiales bacterium]|nr:MAG: hypothetical protein EOP22_08555 [Hyphomicrobiales bacterium]